MRIVLALLLCASSLAAQELEPRSYSASPIGTSFFLTSYSYSSGGILFDPTVPIEGAHGYVSALAVGYGHVFRVGNLQSLFTAALPYAWGPFIGRVTGSASDSMVHRTGVGDLRVKVSTNFIGSPALTPAEFAKRAPQPFIFGASLLVVAPTGQYYPQKVINIGANRWAFKPEVGVSYNWNAKFYLDFYTGCWFFGSNQNSYPGQSTLTQDPMLSFQLHASYTFKPRFYLALDGTWYNGGSTHTNGGPASERTDNSRLGALLAYGFTPTQSVKLSYSDGASVRVGSAFQTIGIAYQILWF